MREERFTTSNNIEFACYRECASPNVLTHDNYCQGTCPTGYTANSSRICMPNCTSSQFYDADNVGTDKCVTASSCLNQPLNNFTISSSMTCVSRCPSHLSFYYASDRVCIASCPNFRTTLGECVSSCPNGKFTENNVCMQAATATECTHGMKFRSSDGACVYLCGPGEYIDMNNQCVVSCDTSLHTKFLYRTKVLDKDS